MDNKKIVNNSTLNDVFNIESTPVETEIVNDSSNELVTDNNDIKSDYEFSRKNLYSLIRKGQAAIDGILDVAEEGSMPRAYEVAGQLIKNVSDATDKLMDLQKKMKDIEDIENKKSTTNVTNALFVGSTAELAKLLKNQSKQD